MIDHANCTDTRAHILCGFAVYSLHLQEERGIRTMSITIENKNELGIIFSILYLQDFF